MATPAQIEIGPETEGPNQWAYEVRVHHGTTTHEYRVTLSWSDYDLWSHGRVAPERVVRAVFEFLLAREPAGEIMSKFDCSVVRRYFPEADRELPGMF
ncbi:MAG: hypothetical protein K8S99_05405 [Planctomycetes bacterium]|nr:hypothetical protein [Planctomycetota bacterium]